MGIGIRQTPRFHRSTNNNSPETLPKMYKLQNIKTQILLEEALSTSSRIYLFEIILLYTRLKIIDYPSIKIMKKLLRNNKIRLERLRQTGTENIRIWHQTIDLCH